MNCKYCKADCAMRGDDNPKDCRGFVPMTNADHIRSMTDEELSKLLDDLYSRCDGPWDTLFAKKFCDYCPAPEYELDDGRKLNLHDCDFTNGECPHGSDVLWWLKQPYKEAQ